MHAFAFAAPNRRPLKVAGMVIAWLAIAGVAFALFNRLAAGTVNIKTTSPDSVPLTLVGSVNFTQAGQDQPITLEADGSAVTDGNESYEAYEYLSSEVASGPCAGLITITGGHGVVSWREPGTGIIDPLVVGVAGNQRRTDGLIATLDPSAGPACQDQPNIPLDVVLTLIP
jgi:hypothetical protein